MDSILGRSQFLSETANLFTDEKTANARTRVVKWLNELVVAEPTAKCELLVKVQETIVESCVELLDEFLEHILSLAHDPSMEIRKQVVGFMEQTCKVKVDLIPPIINVISMLLRDRSAQVIKRVIQACGSIYKNGLQWICSRSEVTDSVEQAWNVLSLVKAQILDLIDHENDGIRTNAIKFLEGIVVLQSYPDEDSQKKENDFSLRDVPDSLKLVNRRKLEEEAIHIFDILVQFHGATHISSVNLITCTGSLCTIAKLRPHFMGPVVEAFKSLNSNLPPTLTDSQVSSVRKSLKMQLIALLKNKGSYEFHGILRHLLLDLGASQNDIQRAIPKMDKQEQLRRQKRILENPTDNLSKKIRLSSESSGSKSGSGPSVSGPKEMEVDEDELKKQRQKSTRVNEKFISEKLRSVETAVNFVVEYLPSLPEKMPTQFATDYEPIGHMSIPQQVAKISKLLGEQMTAQIIGPGAAAFTKEVPMRPKQVHKKDEAMNADERHKRASDQPILDENQTRADEATKKLRETMERLKGEQELIERMRARAKTLKLQEVTKPLPRPLKDKYLLDSVKRILRAERQCIVGGVSAKRRKVVAVMAATFPDNARYFILEFIMEDIKQRIDLAFLWLFEEYCLLQGFTRHSYVKSEHSPDYAYNELLTQLVSGICQRCELRDKVLLLRRVFLKAPLLPDNAVNQLVNLCLEEEYTHHCLDLIQDLVILRPPRKNKFVRILLTYAVHERVDLREFASDHVVSLYHIHKILPHRIEEFALHWISFVEKDTPSPNIFGSEYGRPNTEVTWREETIKICLNLALILLPYKPEVFLGRLCDVFIKTTSDLRRTIMRSIESSIKKIGPDNPELLKLIKNCPNGAETLIIRMVYTLTERTPTPNATLVQHVREMYVNKANDARVLIPILNGLSRQEILNALPKLLKLNSVVVKEVFNRLLSIGAEFANQTVATTPTEILIALHTIDPKICDLKLIVKAISMCLGQKEVFTQEVVTGVLQQLVELVPIPTLIMRTALQSLTFHPKLVNFILNLLQRLILKQVWRQKVVWEGFLRCVQRLKPQSLSVLLQLPPQQIMAALQQCPDLRDPLYEYAESIQDEPMSGITPQIMDIITGKSVDVFITDESGGYISVENIKKEIEDEHISTVPVLYPMPVPVPVPPPALIVEGGQPLPPGEEYN